MMSQILQMERTPNLLLRLEGLTVLIAATLLYFQQGFGIGLFFLLLFAPDIAMVFFAINKRVGTLAYNIVHAYPLPLSLLVAALMLTWPELLPYALIWLAHIGLDRLLGYGLKYPDSFSHTHFDHI